MIAYSNTPPSGKNRNEKSYKDKSKRKAMLQKKWKSKRFGKNVCRNIKGRNPIGAESASGDEGGGGMRIPNQGLEGVEGGRGVRLKAEKNIVTSPILMAEVVVDVPKGTSDGSPGVQDVFELL